MEHIKAITSVVREIVATPLTAFISPLNSDDMKNNPYGNPPGAEATAPQKVTANATAAAATVNPTPPERAKYHAGLAYNCFHRLNLLVTNVPAPLGLTDDYAILLTKRNFEALIEKCRKIAVSVDISQDREIEYLQKKMEEVEEMRMAWVIDKVAEDWRRRRGLGESLLSSEGASGGNGGRTR